MPSQEEGLFGQNEMSLLSDVIGLFCQYDTSLLSVFFISGCMTHTESSGTSLLSGFYISFDRMTKDKKHKNNQNYRMQTKAFVCILIRTTEC